MKAVFAMFGLMPNWCYWLIALVALCLGFEWHGRHAVQVKWDAAIVKQAADDKALADIRAESNRMLARAQSDQSIRIQKAHDDELVKVRSDIAAQRLHVGSALCSASGPANPTGTSGSIGADTGGGLVSDATQQAINQLEVKVENALAAGRAAQAFIRENGMGK